MPPIKTIDELVDEAIENANNKSDLDIFDKDNLDIEDIKKRKPKPFRYLTREESEIELKKESENISIMKNLKTQIFNDDIAILGLGDVGKIENVIRKHQASRKFK